MQIVAGANYRILLDFYCPDNGAWSNGLNTVGFVVNVTVPAEAPDTPEASWAPVAPHAWAEARTSYLTQAHTA